jgi:plasminogen activator inhibitor 1 RNA-binding protein
VIVLASQMAHYGVGTSNSFDVLDEDAPAVKSALKESEQAKQSAKQPSTSSAAPSKDASRTLDAPTHRGARVPRGRGGRGRGFGNRAPKRIFERHSGTGRGKEVRKGGYGGYDAEGTMQDDLKSEEVTMELTAEDANKPAADPVTPAPQQPPAPETEEEKNAREDKEKEDAQIGYDQYLEIQKKKAVEDDTKVQVRKVQIDDKKFKACKQLEKDDDNEFADVLASDKKDSEESKKKNDKKAKKVKHLDEFNAENGGNASTHASNAEFRGRGRGGFRGGRGRGTGRGGFRGGRGGAAQNTQQVNIQDEAAFPKLGK